MMTSRVPLSAAVVRGLRNLNCFNSLHKLVWFKVHIDPGKGESDSNERSVSPYLEKRTSHCKLPCCSLDPPPIPVLWMQWEPLQSTNKYARENLFVMQLSLLWTMSYLQVKYGLGLYLQCFLISIYSKYLFTYSLGHSSLEMLTKLRPVKVLKTTEIRNKKPQIAIAINILY